MELKTLRRSFLDYFIKHEHKVLPSSPLIPQNDPTLMFTNSGMVQFKNYFIGSASPQHNKVATVQKCVRAGGKHNDLENVGYTARHHTFFEMLGNFSFGAYFKDEAIEFAWNLLTKDLQLPKDKLYVTVYHKDEHAAEIWRKVAGLSDDRILKISTNDNFWQMGDTGPCGPCSEIFYDHGDKVWGGLPGTKDQDGDRYIEIWNLVFMQFEQTQDGNMQPLPRPCIDTGAGLERLAAVLQGKHHNYEIDLFQKIIATSMDLSGNSKHLDSHRVIADHLRSSAFLIADGVMPSNEGRGYVLRRIMRRAMRHISQLGVREAMLYRLFPALVSEMGAAYPELERAAATIASTLRFEEERFRETLDGGLKILHNATTNMQEGQVLAGDIAFKLYDTYGFPIDLTRDILKSRKIAVDEAGFEAQMLAQKERGKAAWIGSCAADSESICVTLHEVITQGTDFWGYSTLEAKATVLAIVQNGIITDQVSQGEAVVVLDGTPFYAESGGQIGDTGTLTSIGDNHIQHTVLDAKKYPGGIVGHLVQLGGNLEVGDTVQATVDEARRLKIMANHSATHLLHKALKLVIGEHVAQKGSMVAADRLRFDFSHTKPLTHDEKLSLEKLVNNWVLLNDLVSTEVMETELALSKGAMALFGEKYGDTVRVVDMGESMELCGGTHVERTGDIGLFKIISEEAIASGVRRIEAFTGIAALNYVNEQLNTLSGLAGALKCSTADAQERINALLLEKKTLQNALEEAQVRAVIGKANKVNTAGILYLHEESAPSSLLRVMCSAILQHNNEPKAVVLTSGANGALNISITVRQGDSTHNANAIVQQVTTKFGGKGGGNQQMAQAGGIAATYSDIDKLMEQQ
ncbi:MAG: alanine--tRNA ligase [Proteobacteria bacterium]|nr:alanine--tRNA ligase [Pseudomonadota bacterium]